MTEKEKGNAKLGEVKRSFKPGEEAGYQTDTFSRNDAEGVPADSLSDAPDETAGTSSVDATPKADRKASDDAASREARPMTPREGGVR